MHNQSLKMLIEPADRAAVATIRGVRPAFVVSWSRALALAVALTLAQSVSAQVSGGAEQPAADRPPTRADILRGDYGPSRANNDLLSYHLDVRVDPARKWISGKNTIRFRMLQDDKRIQLDLYANLTVERILLGATPLAFERELNTVFVTFPHVLEAGGDYSIDFYYSGSPQESGRFGGLAFRTDAAGRPWITTACEDLGASVWWPNKDQWRDEVEEMRLSVAIPNGLVDVSNGTLTGTTDLGDGYTRWDWLVQYPINNYSVTLNIGQYVHFADRFGDLPLDYYVLPENLDKAKRQFAQTVSMLEAFQTYVGDYPFARDGFKLVEVPYAGMEHQSALAYGNRFANGYLERDFSGTGISTRFDFIIVHESAHEWFGNAVSAADVSDMWIHEGWATYLESLYVEHVFGRDDARRYINGYKTKVKNLEPVITERGIHRTPDQDMYFKGALFLHTLRNVVDDDNQWFLLLREVFREFAYRNILTEELERFMSARLGLNLAPLFNQYLRQTQLPTLDLAFQSGGTMAYRWDASERDFAMPVKVRVASTGRWQVLQATSDWQLMPAPGPRDAVEVATELFYINVRKQ